MCSFGRVSFRGLESLIRSHVVSCGAAFTSAISRRRLLEPCCTFCAGRRRSGASSDRRDTGHQKSRSRRASSTAMTKTDADCLRLLPDRPLGSFHRLRDLHHRCPCFRMGFELPQILFSPRIANGGLLFRHDFHPPLRRIGVLSSRPGVEPIRLKLSTS